MGTPPRPRVPSLGSNSPVAESQSARGADGPVPGDDQSARQGEATGGVAHPFGDRQSGANHPPGRVAGDDCVDSGGPRWSPGSQRNNMVSAGRQPGLVFIG